MLELLTSWRNLPQALRVANGISAEARRRSVAVRALRPRPDAPPGAVRCALLPDVQAEREWIADHLRMRYQRAEADGVKPPTAAVLVRRNADAAAIADTLRARGIPAEVVGLAGLLSIPEVAEVVAMLRLVADPTAGAAAMRVLTGPRWRLGARDLAALWRRALTLSGESPSTASPESIAMAASADADNPCLADAISDPGSAEGYSVAGYGRIGALAGELSALRGRLGHSLPDLVAEVRRVLGVDCEVRASAPVSGGWAGPEHLDAFADVVAGYAERASARSSEASVAGLLAYLDVAEVVENGLPPAELTVACDRVQVLTVHAAKGLEWQVVAVAHLSRGVFPSTVSRSSWLTDPAELPPLLRGDRASAGAHGIPVLDTSAVADRKQLSDKISEHRRLLDRRRVDEERRLLYVAVTRAEDTLLVSGHHWGPPGQSRAGHRNSCANSRTSLTVRPLPVILAESSSSGRRRPPAMSETHCVTTLSRRFGPLIRWPHVAAMWSGARRWWRRPCRPTCPEAPPTSIIPAPGRCPWSTDVDALLAERAHAARGAPARGLPNHLSVSSLVELVGDPVGARQRLMCRLPKRPDPHAWLGDAFHAWVQQFYGAELLFDLGDLPGAADREVGDPEELAALQRAFTASSWAARTPAAVEVPFEMPIGDTVVRGRIDAVFVDPDGGATVVDWKTGKPPHGPAAMRQAAVQLAVYRLAWAALRGCPTSSVRTAFYYVRSGITVVPDELPAPGELAMLLTDCAGRRSDT